jgi:hypothetical protein
VVPEEVPRRCRVKWCRRTRFQPGAATLCHTCLCAAVRVPRFNSVTSISPANPPVVRLQPSLPRHPLHVRLDQLVSSTRRHPVPLTRVAHMRLEHDRLPVHCPTICGVRWRSGGELCMGSRSACALRRPKRSELYE